MSTRRLAWALAAALAGSGCAAVRPPPPPQQGLLPPLPGPSNGRVAISGRVDDRATGRPIADARVLLSCSCLLLPQTVETAEDGTYFVGDLPPGDYSVQTVHGAGHVTQKFAVPPGARFAANFAVDPQPRTIEALSEPGPDVANRSLLSDGCPRWSKWAPQCRQDNPRPVRATHLR